MQRCHRSILGVFALFATAFAVATPAAAQERELQFVRESLFKLSLGDIPAFDAFVNEHVAPILAEMQEAGRIQGYASNTHHTGGEYNYRTTIRFYDWASIDLVVGDLVQGLEASAGSDLNRLQALILSHSDDIWRVDEQNFAEDQGPTNYLYDAVFSVKGNDMPRFLELFESSWRPGLQAGIDAGLLNGYVRMSHAHGGPGNVKLLYFYSDWDSMDDAFNLIFSTGGERLMEAVGMVYSHHDNLWVSGVLGVDN